MRTEVGEAMAVSPPAGQVFDVGPMRGGNAWRGPMTNPSPGAGSDPRGAPPALARPARCHGPPSARCAARATAPPGTHRGLRRLSATPLPGRRRAGRRWHRAVHCGVEVAEPAKAPREVRRPVTRVAVASHTATVTNLRGFPDCVHSPPCLDAAADTGHEIDITGCQGARGEPGPADGRAIRRRGTPTGYRDAPGVIRGVGARRPDSERRCIFLDAQPVRRVEEAAARTAHA